MVLVTWPHFSRRVVNFVSTSYVGVLFISVTPKPYPTTQVAQLLRQYMGLKLSQAEELAEMEETSGWVYARGIMVFAGVY